MNVWLYEVVFRFFLEYSTYIAFTYKITFTILFGLARLNIPTIDSLKRLKLKYVYNIMNVVVALGHKSATVMGRLRVRSPLEAINYYLLIILLLFSLASRPGVEFRRRNSSEIG